MLVGRDDIHIVQDGGDFDLVNVAAAEAQGAGQALGVNRDIHRMLLGVWVLGFDGGDEGEQVDDEVRDEQPDDGTEVR